MILYKKTLKEFGYEYDSLARTSSKKVWCQCDYCNIEFIKTKLSIIRGIKIINNICCRNNNCQKLKREESQLKIYGVKNAGYTAESAEKIKQTNLKKFGVDNYNKLPEAQKKRRMVNLAKYGVEEYMSTQEFRDKSKVTCIKKYGVENSGQNKKLKEKSKQTQIERYGCFYSQTEEWKKRVEVTSLKKYGETNYTKTKEYKERVIKTRIKKYGVAYLLQSEKLRQKVQNTLLKRYGVTATLQLPEFKDKFKKTCLDRFGTEHPNQNPKIIAKILETRLRKYGTLAPVNTGKTQLIIQGWINSLGFNFYPNYMILNNKEIDMYDNDLKLGIEYCGLYWHHEFSSKRNDIKTSHYNKYKKCLESGIRLITIFEDEWTKRQSQVKNYIKNILNIKLKEQSISNLKVKTVSNNEANIFLDQYDINGKVNNIKISYGLFKENELLAIIVLSLFKQNLILSRFCLNSNFSLHQNYINQLFLKCINYSKANNFNEIIVLSDNRWTNGKEYEDLGFKLLKEIDINYDYVYLSNTREGRYSRDILEKKYSKDQLLQMKFSPIWNCGEKIWIYDIH